MVHVYAFRYLPDDFTVGQAGRHEDDKIGGKTRETRTTGCYSIYSLILARILRGQLAVFKESDQTGA